MHAKATSTQRAPLRRPDLPRLDRGWGKHEMLQKLRERHP